MSVATFGTIAAIVFAGWLISRAIDNAIRKGDTMREMNEYFSRVNQQARNLTNEEPDRSRISFSHFGKVVLYPPLGGPLTYDFPAIENPDELLCPLSFGVQRQLDGTLRIHRPARPSLGLTSLDITTSLPYAVFVEETRIRYYLHCDICRITREADEKTFHYGANDVSYVCEDCKANGYKPKAPKPPITFAEAARVLPKGEPKP